MNGLLALLKKDGRVAHNLRRLARLQSRFKTAFILSFALGLLGGLWCLFLEGFQFFHNLGGIGLTVIHHLFAVFFFGLGLMLVLSNAVTGYTALFRSGEMPSLLLRPIPYGQLALHKLLETTLLSSWAFFFILIPFIGAYAWHERLSPWFCAWTLIFSIPLVLFCAAVGLLAILAAVRWIPRLAPWVWGAGALLVIAGALWMPHSRQELNDVNFFIARLVPGMKASSFPLWPSWWVAEGIMAAARGQWLRSLLLWSVLMANVLLIGLAVERAGAAWLLDAWRKAQGAAHRPRRGRTWPDGLGAVLAFLAPDVRAIAVKDLRILLRDPVQWTQGLLFFGLLGLYFFNLRNLHYHLLDPVWHNLIAFLNLFSLSAIMCSFCSRFVFPQLSLEGHSFWVLGLSPVSLRRILLIKFALHTAGLLGLSLALALLSTGMLGVHGGARWVALLIAAAMPCALCGLAVGLGAVFLDLRQHNPMAIISGFGGTLNLALSLGYMILAIFPFAFLYHQYYTLAIRANELRHGLLYATLWLAGVTLTATMLPLWLGRRSLLAREY